MTHIQHPAGEAVRSWPSFRTVIAAVVLVLGGCSARSAVAVAAPPPEAGSQEAASNPGPDKTKNDKPAKKAGEGTNSAAAESSKSSAQSDESAKSGKSDKPDNPAAADGDSSAKLSSVETVDERRTRLQGELDSSLREFDGLILKEQELLEEKQAEAESAGGGGGGGADEGGQGESGEATGTGGAGGAEGGKNSGATAEASAGGTGGSPDTPAGEPGGGGATDAGGDPGQIANGRVPPDVGDGHDDDIVARQLREAAMQEQDPALREKLWDEYRAYKFGTTKGSEKDGNGGDGSNKDKKKDNPT